MKSIKPGRGPSAMGSMGSVFAGIFGIVWIGAAASMGAPPFFILFGVIFVIMAIVQAIYHFKNATGRNRMSVFDITEHEPDPLDRYVRQAEGTSTENRDSLTREDSAVQYCPYCGNKVSDESHRFCAKCGRELRA